MPLVTCRGEPLRDLLGARRLEALGRGGRSAALLALLGQRALLELLHAVRERGVRLGQRLVGVDQRRERDEEAVGGAVGIVEEAQLVNFVVGVPLEKVAQGLFPGRFPGGGMD